MTFSLGMVFSHLLGGKKIINKLIANVNVDKRALKVGWCLLDQSTLLEMKETMILPHTGPRLFGHLFLDLPRWIAKGFNAFWAM